MARASDIASERGDCHYNGLAATGHVDGSGHQDRRNRHGQRATDTDTLDGKKAEAAWAAKFDSLRKVVEAKQQQITDAQNKLKTQDRLLADTAKASLTKDVERWQIELTRLQEDSQKELDAMRADVMKPIAQVAEAVVNAYAMENGFSLILDISNPQNESIIWTNPKADITDVVTKLIDTEMAKAPAAPAAPAAAKKPTPR